ncbi:MAG: histidine kinase [Clostridia bacterium]|nr:histidine kinase [Clostridia bacterium]
MMSWVYGLEFSIIGALLAMMLLGVAFSAFMPAIDRWSRRYFITLFSLLFLCSASCFLAALFWEDPSKITATKIVYIFEGLLLSTPIFMPTTFLLHSCGESTKKSLLFKLTLVLMGLYVITVFAAPFTNKLYIVTAENEFIRGPWYSLSLIPIFLVMILNVAAVIRRKNKLSKRHYTVMLIYMIPMTVTLFVHMFIPVEIFIVFGMALFALIMLGLIMADNVEQHARQQREIANQRASVMVLQMRPHFIYNTLMSIYSLCNQDPQKARQVTLDFTNYLRKNFSAVASENTVAFSAELEHTRAYLAVEKAQYEDQLVVEYDTPFIQFRLPPLTLQPIVENAVKHGMDLDEDALQILIKTRQTNGGFTLTVKDTGKGFGKCNNNDPHIALNNIRQRLEMMCGGALSCKSSENGTTVTVFVPCKN